MMHIVGTHSIVTDGHTALIASKSMLMSKCFQNSCHTCSQILLEVLCPFRVYRQHSLLLAVLVCPSSFSFFANLDLMF